MTRHLHTGWRPLLAVFPLLAAGCYSYPYYGNPYGGGTMGAPAGGYYSSPGTYPPANTYPATPYPSSGYPAGGTMGPTGPSYIPMAPSTGSGSGLSPTPLNNPPLTSPTQPTPTWRQQSPTDAPTFNNPPPTFSNPPPTNFDKPVPSPTNDDFGAPPTSLKPSQQDELGVSPFEPTSKLAPSRPPAMPTASLPTSVDEDLFEPPQTLQPVSGTQLPGNPPASTHYGYDAVGYKWLKGQIDYDDSTGTYYLIYNLTPPANDVYGGEIALMDNGQLKSLTPNDFVLVEGFPNTVHKDNRGKPRYQIQNLKPIQLLK